jgi:hypothetical protein
MIHEIGAIIVSFVIIIALAASAITLGAFLKLTIDTQDTAGRNIIIGVISVIILAFIGVILLNH